MHQVLLRIFGWKVNVAHEFEFSEIKIYQNGLKFWAIEYFNVQDINFQIYNRLLQIVFEFIAKITDRIIAINVLLG